MQWLHFLKLFHRTKRKHQRRHYSNQKIQSRLITETSFSGAYQAPCEDFKVVVGLVQPPPPPQLSTTLSTQSSLLSSLSPFIPSRAGLAGGPLTSCLRLHPSSMIYYRPRALARLFALWQRRGHKNADSFKSGFTHHPQPRLCLFFFFFFFSAWLSLLSYPISVARIRAFLPPSKCPVLIAILRIIFIKTN